MGCQINVWLETANNGEGILQQVPVWTEEIEARLSRFRPESELSRLNARPGSWVKVSDLLLENIMAAKQGARLTDGLYNPLTLTALINAGYENSFEKLTPSDAKVEAVHVPDWREIRIDREGHAVCLPAPIDLGGVAKGWTAQYITNQLKAFGSCVVDIGGDMVVHDPINEPGRAIEVGEPGDEGGYILKVALKTGSIVTSGTDYRCWQKGGQPQHHLIDPRTGLPAQTDVVSATVIHPHTPTAEAYAKAILILGSDAGLAWVNQQWERAALVVRDDGAVVSTDTFQKFVLEGALI
jgi:thiamine biosynthesis lipoprotein